jgi:hypothetical protein
MPPALAPARVVARRASRSRKPLRFSARRVVATTTCSTSPPDASRGAGAPSSSSTIDGTAPSGQGRRSFLRRAGCLSTCVVASAPLAAAVTTLVTVAGPANAANESAAVTASLAPFVSKAGFFMRVPGGWVKAMDRSGDPGDGAGSRSGETLALVGNFRDIDTVSVRREPIANHLDFARIVDGSSDVTSGVGDEAELVDPDIARLVASTLTSTERSAVEANQSVGVVPGVEGGSSGVMDFRLGEASVFTAEGSTGTNKTQAYFVYDYYTEVCRAKIEEVSGGAKQCIGPRGDVLDTIQRRNFTVATRSDGYVLSS